MGRLDSMFPKKIRFSIGRAKEDRPIAFPLYYFYRSLRVVLAMWILLLITVLVYPWTNYLARNKTSHEQVLSSQTEKTAPAELKPVPEQELRPFFILKKANENPEKALDINVPIAEGIAEKDLTKGIGHHPDSVWPNERGNMVVAGHSFNLDPDNDYGRVFENLRELEIGDQVTVRFEGKFYIYRIFNKTTVDDTDISLFGQTNAWQLTFYTCDPPKTDWRRLVFQAELEKIE